jgi:hypothetical protein
VSFDAQRLYELLPAIYRIRDVEQDNALRELLSVVAEQVALLEENLDQLYDDQFIETCAEWVVPYIGDLIGYRALHGDVPAVRTPRSEVANTIRYRRGKGTAVALEQVARDVSSWPAHAVEFFQLLSTTQYMNHLRLDKPYTPDLRRWEPLERLGTPFDTIGHTINVRRIGTAKGLYNIPNIGIFLWRLQAYRLRRSPAVAVDPLRFLFSPLGNNTPLVTSPETRIRHLAAPLNVPLPISRRVLDQDLRRSAADGTPSAYYGGDQSFLIEADGAVVPSANIQACNLSDSAGAWAHQPTTFIAVDPVLGRIAFPSGSAPPQTVNVTFHYGFSADIGGGFYDRDDTFTRLQPNQALVKVPDDHANIQDALDALPSAGGIVEITDSGRYTEALAISVGAHASVELRAKNECRPTLVLLQEMLISGAAAAEVTLNGLLIALDAAAPSGAPGISVPAGNNALHRLSVRHCTIVPGLCLDIENRPQRPDQVSITVEADEVTVELDHSIVGSVRIQAASVFTAKDSIIDATATLGVAYAAADGRSAGGPLTLDACTVIGRIHTKTMNLVSNSILLAELDAADKEWKAPVWSARKQEGCVRFSYLPRGSLVPRRYRCQPDLEITAAIERRKKAAQVTASERAAIAAEVEASLVPAFTTLRYGLAAYAQLTQSCSLQIRTGADDESEMGAFHALYQPQREANVALRLDEYLRFGLEAGIFLI